PPLLVHFVSGPQTDLEKIRAFIQQLPDALARREPAHFALAFLANLSPTLAQDRFFAQDRYAALAQNFASSGRSARSHPALLWPKRRGGPDCFKQSSLCAQLKNFVLRPITGFTADGAQAPAHA